MLFITPLQAQMCAERRGERRREARPLDCQVMPRQATHRFVHAKKATTMGLSRWFQIGGRARPTCDSPKERCLRVRGASQAFGDLTRSSQIDARKLIEGDVFELHETEHRPWLVPR